MVSPERSILKWGGNRNENQKSNGGSAHHGAVFCSRSLRTEQPEHTEYAKRTEQSGYAEQPDCKSLENMYGRADT